MLIKQEFSLKTQICYRRDIKPEFVDNNILLLSNGRQYSKKYLQMLGHEIYHHKSHAISNCSTNSSKMLRTSALRKKLMTIYKNLEDNSWKDVYGIFYTPIDQFSYLQIKPSFVKHFFFSFFLEILKYIRISAEINASHLYKNKDISNWEVKFWNIRCELHGI